MADVAITKHKLKTPPSSVHLHKACPPDKSRKHAKDKYETMFKNYQWESQAIVIGGKKLFFGVKNFEEDYDPNKELVSDNFTKMYAKLRWFDNFAEKRQKLEYGASKYGYHAMVIKNTEEGVFHMPAKASNIQVDFNGDLLKITVDIDQYEVDGIGYILQETYDHFKKEIRRDVVFMNGDEVSGGLENYPYDLPAKESYADTGIMPVVLFRNNHQSVSDTKYIEQILVDAAELSALTVTYAKITLPRIIHKAYEGTKTIEEVEGELVGDIEKIKTIIDLQDSDNEFDVPFTTLTPSNSVDKHLNVIKELLGMANKFSFAKRDIAEKGTVQQSRGEIAEMNTLSQVYLKVKEELRLEQFSKLATKVNRILIAKTPFSGDEEAVYEAKFGEGETERIEKLNNQQPMPVADPNAEKVDPGGETDAG